MDGGFPLSPPLDKHGQFHENGVISCSWGASLAREGLRAHDHSIQIRFRVEGLPANGGEIDNKANKLAYQVSAS